MANQATVVVEGTVTDASARWVTLQLDRIIRAELAEYTLRIYLHRLPGDSTLVAERKRLVCGDVFVIYGQSNAIGGAGLDNRRLTATSLRFIRHSNG